MVIHIVDNYIFVIYRTPFRSFPWSRWSGPC